MGHRRIQKTSKHKKIKAVDPFYSGPRKTAQFKADKGANKEPSEQRMPRKLLDMMERKQQMHTSKSKTKSRNKFRQQAEDSAAPKEFKQKKYETVSKFCRRMDKAAQEAITKAELEVQFDVQFDRQGKNKLVVSTSKNVDPVLETNDGRKRKHATATEDEPTLTKSQKRKAKDVAKKEEKRLNRFDAFEDMRDDVEFGEVVEAPPDMKSAPRKAPEVKRMGEKLLLLRKVLEPEPEEDPQERSIFDPIPDATIASVAKARQEERRMNAVQAYRQIKKQKAAKARSTLAFE